MVTLEFAFWPEALQAPYKVLVAGVVELTKGILNPVEWSLIFVRKG